MQIKRYFSYSFLCVAGLALLLTACAPPKPIKLGFIAGVSGHFADLGGTGRNGAILAVELRNKAGGIGGRPVELLLRDDEQDAEKAKSRALELINEGVLAIVGPMTSSMGVAIAPLGDEHKIVIMGATVTTTSLSGKDDYFFRVIASTKVYAHHAALYHREHWDVKTASLIIDMANKDYAESWMQDYKTTLESKGGQVVNVVRFDSRMNKNYEAIALAALKTKSDVVAMVCSSTDAALFGQKLRQAAPGIKLAGGGWTASERLLELGGKAIDGMLVEQYFDRSDTSEKYRQFHAAFVARFGHEPGFAGVAGYDAANVVMDALRQEPSREKLRAELLKQRVYQGLQDEIRFDDYGDASRKLFLTEVKNGQFVPLAGR